MSRRRANTNSLVATAAPAQFRGRLALAAALLLATLSVIVVARAGAQGGSGEPGCKQTPNPPCVIMIQVDGLKATDITPEKTPFLYRFMAHPAQGDPPPFDDRHGWIWQAGRSSVNAGLAANTASYLIGGYPEQTGVPADDFRLGHSEGSQRIRLGSDPDAPIPPVTAAEVDNKTLFNLVKENLGDEFDTSAFVGDPNLGPMVVGPLDGEEEEREVSIGWYPTPQNMENQGDPENPQNPLLCDMPRNLTDPPQNELPACATTDSVTLARAYQELNTGDADAVTLTYIELAELGRIRRGSPDPEAATPALQQMDAALAGFFGFYGSDASPTTSQKWDQTIVMITGTGGYEATPPERRVPDPDPADVGQDLANDVRQFDQQQFELLPQGTMATVYPSDGANFNDTPAQPSAAHRTSLAQLRARILSVNDVCEPACIKEVLYVRPQLLPDGGSIDDTVKGAHPDWHIDHLAVSYDQQQNRSTTPTGRSGDLLVVLEPGWAAGKSTPALPGDLASQEEVLTNPYPSSNGGPRSRSVATIINGYTGGETGVKALTDRNGATTGYYPVSDTPEGTPDDPECDADNADADPAKLIANNDPATADLGDDANAFGHECQAEVLDFAPTVAALLKVAMPADQICGRLLNEAFNSPLTLTTDAQDELDAFFIAGPVTPAPGQAYPQTEENVTFQYNTTTPVVTAVDCGDEIPRTTVFECKLDGADYTPCGTAVDINTPISLSVGPLSKGLHTFCVRAVNENVRPNGVVEPSEPECAVFEVVDFFDFHGLLRDLQVAVTDFDGNRWGQAPRGRRMNYIAMGADYGKKQSAVTMTIYRQSKGKKLCGPTVYRPKASAAAAGGPSAQTARCPLTGMARFKPFKLDRGHIELRLRVPKAYKPTHVGLGVQEVTSNPIDPAACGTSQDLFCLYSKVGSAGGGIVRIVDAKRLHKVKGCKVKGEGKAREKRIRRCQRRFARAIRG